MDERPIDCPPERPLVGWRLFRVRRSAEGFMLSAPLIHDPDFERYPSNVIEATCYEHDHPAPAPGCRCGLYAAVEGTLDSMSGYLKDSAHDPDPHLYAEVACSGRVFVDARGVRAERLQVLALAAGPLAPTPAQHHRVVSDLATRYRVEVLDLDRVPGWLLSNVAARGAPPNDAVVDLDALLRRLGYAAASRRETPGTS